MKLAKPTLVKILICTPVLAAIPVFFIVGESIPDLNGGSIGDGFRRLNVFLNVVFPVTAVCWGAAFLISFVGDLRKGRLGSMALLIGVLLLVAALSI
jgi:hypothetical protein